MISTSQKEHLTYTAIGQILVIAGAIIVALVYIVPGFETINTRLSEANAAIAEYTSTEKSGLTFEKLGSLLSSIKGKEELIAIITAAPVDEVKSVLRSDGSGKYLTWLKQAIASSDEDRKKLVQIKQKINSILPTLSPMSSNIDEENITLKQYVKFIEEKFLKDFNLDSNLTLGLGGVNYGSTDGKIPRSIGTLDLSLDFKSTNANIAKLITFVNDSGNGDILTDSGSASSTDAPGIMSNPLLTIESISLQNTLDTTKPNAENTGRAIIRFYVRGSSKDDLIFLASSIKTRGNDLKKKIDNAVTQCKANSTLCGNLSDLEAFQLKYTDFSKSISAIASQSTASTIEGLSQQVNSLRALEKEFEDLVPTSVSSPTTTIPTTSTTN